MLTYINCDLQDMNFDQTWEVSSSMLEFLLKITSTGMAQSLWKAEKISIWSFKEMKSCLNYSN